jgi:TonB family protein
MNEYIIYLIQLIVSSGIMYFLYALLFKNTTYFRNNRLYLILTLLLPLALPLINIPTNSVLVAESSIPIVLDEVIISASGNVIKTNSNVFNYSFILYGFITAILLLRIVFSIVRIIKISNSSQKLNYGDFTLVISNESINPFSVFRYVFVNRTHFNNKSNLEQILSHEKVHIKKLHSIDNILSELICSVFWINPFFWLIKDKLKSIHEYQADEQVIEQGFNIAGYFTLLFDNIVGKRIELVNNFNQSLTLKRMKMMKKNRSPRYMRLAYLLVFPIAAILLFAFSSNNADAFTTNGQQFSEIISPDDDTIKRIEVTGEIYEGADEMPIFGKEQDKLFQFLSSEVKYPEQAKLDSIQGRVFVSFVVTKTGQVANVEVVKGVHELLDSEAVRAVSLLPDFIPGKNEGVPVNVKMVVPIAFQLN